MSQQDALLLSESLDVGDVSQAWLNAGISWLVALLLLLLFFLARFKLIGGLLLILRSGLCLIAAGGLVVLLSLCSALLFGRPWLPAVDKGRGSKSVEVRRIWEVYDERLQFMSRQDASQLDESLGAGDVSSAWLVWSSAAETALADAYCFSGGPAPCQGLVFGRGVARFRLVRLGGHKVRKVRSDAVDVHDAADVFLYRDYSVAPLLDMRRRFRAVMDILDAMMRSGISLARSVELTHCSMGQDSCCWPSVSCYS